MCDVQNVEIITIPSILPFTSAATDGNRLYVVPVSLHQFFPLAYMFELPHCRQGTLLTEDDAFVLAPRSFPLVFMLTKKEPTKPVTSGGLVLVRWI